MSLLVINRDLREQHHNPFAPFEAIENGAHSDRRIEQSYQDEAATGDRLIATENEGEEDNERGLTGHTMQPSRLHNG